MPRAEEAGDAGRLRGEAPDRPISRALRPGVEMPDWSAVTSETARRAVEASFAVADRHEKWAGLGDDEDRVWRAVLEGFASAGLAPDVAAIAAATGLGPAAVGAALDRLRVRDLVVRAENTGAVTAAYPFSEWRTGHRVRWNGMAVNALCAIDALGMGAMLGRDIIIEAECRQCSAPIRVTTRLQGSEIAATLPEGTVVWSGVAYAGNCGATTGCTLKVFFCSDEHLHAWREAEKAPSPGFRLSVDEAHQVGRAIFAPMLSVRSGRTA
jgi:alkylmercury lyase-like protein